MTPSDPPLQRALTARGAFAFTDVGDGPVIVAVHGLPGSGRDYRYLGAALEPRARFVRLDMPGFGGTPRESGEGLGVEARAAFVVSALEALDISRCALVGHSMGGPVALVAAARAPERIEALGLLASVGMRPHRLLHHTLGRSWLGTAIDLPILGPLALRAATAGFRASGFPSSTPPSEVAQTMRVLGAFDFASMERGIATLRAPTLTAFCDDDPFIEPAILEELDRSVPRGPRLRWSTGGHNLQKSHAVELADALLAFARGARPPQRA